MITKTASCFLYSPLMASHSETQQWAKNTKLSSRTYMYINRACAFVERQRNRCHQLLVPFVVPSWMPNRYLQKTNQERVMKPHNLTICYYTQMQKTLSSFMNLCLDQFHYNICSVRNNLLDMDPCCAVRKFNSAFFFYFCSISCCCVTFLLLGLLRCRCEQSISHIIMLVRIAQGSHLALPALRTALTTTTIINWTHTFFTTTNIISLMIVTFSFPLVTIAAIINFINISCVSSTIFFSTIAFSS